MDVTASAQLTQCAIEGTLMYRYLVWAEKLAKEGYTVLYIVYSTGEKYSSKNNFWKRHMALMEEIIDRIITTFSFLIGMGYILEPVEIDNEDDPELISATLIFTNIQANRSVFIGINVRKEIRLPIIIQKIAPQENLPLVDYIAFKNGQRPHYNPPFILEEDNFADSIEEVTMIVRNLFETSLKEVVEGKEWIRIPSYDPRDQSNYH